MSSKKGISLCITSGKGGVGKTFLSLNLAASLAMFNIKTIVVDANLDCPDVGICLGNGSYYSSLHDVLAGRDKLSNAVFDSGYNFDIIPGDISVNALRDINLENLEDVLTKLTQEYNVVLVDTPPGIGDAVISSLSACESMMVVTSPVISSVVNGLKIQSIGKRLNTECIGVVLNMTGDGGIISKENIEKTFELPVIGEVEYNPEVNSYLTEGDLFVASNPSSNTSRAIKKIAADLVGYEPEETEEVKSEDNSQIKKIIKALKNL